MLENGMQVVVVTNRRAPVVTQMWWLKAGAISDPYGRSGIAHFLEHLLFKGTKHTAEGEYSKTIARLGGRENALTSQDYTAYYATIGRAHLETAMRLEADRIANWKIDDDQIATERDVVLKEREQRIEDDPVSAFFEEVNGVLYEGHPYERPVIGFRHEIAALDRQAAEDFFNRHYAPNNIVLIISGDVSLAEIMPLLKKYYEPIPARRVDARLSPPVLRAPEKRRVEKSSPLVKQAIWSAHFLTEAARPENVAASDALTVYTKILGDGRTGRLYRRLVVKEKLATSAYIAYNPISFGPARLTVAVSPKPGADVARIEAVVAEEIEKIAARDIPDDELENARKALEIAAAYARDSVTGPAMALGRALVSDLDIASVENWPVRIRAVSRDDVKRAAAWVASEYPRGVIAVLTPEKVK